MKTVVLFLLAISSTFCGSGQTAEHFSDYIDVSSNGTTKLTCPSLVEGLGTVTNAELVPCGSDYIPVYSFYGLISRSRFADGSAGSPHKLFLQYRDGLFIERNGYSGITDPRNIPTHTLNHLLTSVSGNRDSYKDVLFLLTDENESGQYVIFTYLENQRIIAFPFLITGNLTGVQHVLEFEFGTLKKPDLKVVWMGPPNKVINSKYLSSTDIPFFRRSRNVAGTLPASFRFTDKQMLPRQTAICNGVPRSEEELLKMGKGLYSKSQWFRLHDDIKNMNGFAEQIRDVAALKGELLNGDNDVVFIFAHSDGKSFYLNGHRVTFDDLKNWQKRETKTENRTAILVVCDAGNESLKSSMAAILINQGYFSNVYCPEAAIDDNATRKILKLISEKATLSKIKSELKELLTIWVKK